MDATSAYCPHDAKDCVLAIQFLSLNHLKVDRMASAFERVLAEGELTEAGIARFADTWRRYGDSQQEAFADLVSDVGDIMRAEQPEQSQEGRHGEN